jgi:flagellar protein FliS
MLLEGALGKIAAAKGHMDRGEIRPKGEQIGSAISILEGLKTSLDMEKGGEIARNLEDLYTYMERRLIEANRVNDTALLDEVSDLLKQIKEAWDAIAGHAAGQEPAA